MAEIIIGKPYINELNNCTRLEALIKGPNFEKVAYFEVQKEFGEYFCYERSDAFVVDLFYFSLINGYDIKCMVPMSEKLYYQLTRVLIPTMVKSCPSFFHAIKIFAELESTPIKNAKGVGASVSGGVDSFYTIVSNMNTETSGYDVTHLLVANSYNMYRGEDDTRKRFAETVSHAKIIANDLGLPLITMYSNHSDFWYQRYQNIFCAKYASYPFALQKLFSKYHFSSGYEYFDFSLSQHDWDSSHYDAVSVPQFSNENFEFLLSGGAYGRTEKVIHIADHPVVQKRLQVCNIQQENCSVCGKCIRTQFNLYANGKLQYFENAFKLEEFYKRKDKELLRMLARREIFDMENIQMMKKNNVTIPAHIKLLGGILRYYFAVRQVIRNSYLYKMFKKVELNSEIAMIERYNMDKEFAKSCDSGII